MLKRLDKYLIGQYLQTFAFTVLIFSVLACVVHYSEQVQRFVDNDVTWAEGLTYFVWYVPYINSLLFPLYALVSVIFFTSRLAGNSEILSMLNAGMSLTRIARPYLIGAFVIAGVSLALNHVIVPYGNQHRLGFERTRLGREKDLGRNSEVHMFITPQTKVYVRHYSKGDSVARDMRLETYDGAEAHADDLGAARAVAGPRLDVAPLRSQLSHLRRADRVLPRVPRRAARHRP